MDLEIVIKQLKRHEGFSGTVYKDTLGVNTIGYGRNLDHVGVSLEEAEMLLRHDVQRSVLDAKSIFPTFETLSDNRKAVLINMAFNLGAKRLSMFAKFRKAIINEEWETAAKEMLDSRWAEQVKSRANELATLMKEG